MRDSYKFVLVDLDGTISDPRLGIVHSVQYAAKKMNLRDVQAAEVEAHIGPPLQETFAEVFGLDETETISMIHFYREYFKKTGMFENVLYPGIQELLETLKPTKRLVVATSKPTEFAEKIVSYFQIDPYFELVAGSNLDGTRTTKTEIIRFILEQYGEYKPEDFVMIGDRKQDIHGARQNGIDSIGVTYGFGSPAEIKEAQPNHIVDTVSELEKLFYPFKLN
ncbi:HAD-IA family hydrolase [Peribacillus psychrosaccharolyticus]|uniref:HAD-IA family hydrolase n=1 Tax=Peribacillus psychrosaccharolyticus TaxID=1407 RepID=A0A974NRU2_PERPY|nr:HAD-IA family hydrolase [Peribacillus psychrosaccharolyticus]MEC2055291.1 HAD-IA family hydrolase [Peribacillus psychrosaccharolyticus]MED3745281.1 HAD-IA family hydrolase [Peribacillus psychrosaccharolyticus]QQT02700.1 HAD-IA family hydrolase [Peribacillus psychrosaccharolyticus]